MKIVASSSPQVNSELAMWLKSGRLLASLIVLSTTPIGVVLGNVEVGEVFLRTELGKGLVGGVTFDVLEAGWLSWKCPLSLKTFVQRSTQLGRQFWHSLPAFTQAQLLQLPVLLHRQQFTVLRTLLVGIQNV